MWKRKQQIIILTSVVFAVTIVLSALSCKHDPIASSVCFESEVLPIFLSRCAITGCHDGQSAAHGVILTDYQNIINSGIHPGSASQSKIYRSMNGGEEMMPPTGRIDDQSLAIIRSWIEAGAEANSGCSLDTVSCDTTNVTYSQTVQPLFNTHCVGCHNSGSSFNFDGYTPLSTYLTANAQKLIDDINYTGAQQMPPTGMMNECNRRKMIIWIQSGYPNN
jgi:hypothetical protein